MRRLPQKRLGEETTLRMAARDGDRRTGIDLGTQKRLYQELPDVIHHPRKYLATGGISRLEIDWRGRCLPASGTIGGGYLCFGE